jgi:hypothetical protein
MWDNPDRESALAMVYLSIIERYKDYIEEKENISVAELPTLVTPKEASVARKAEEIKAGIMPYYFDSKFEEASRIAFQFVRDKIGSISLPIQFWLLPRETLAFGLGDSMDRCILLCSILIALGNPSAKVLIRIKDNERKVCVYCEHRGRFFFFDLKEMGRIFQTREELLGSLKVDEETTVYEFNDQTYRDIN